MVFLRRDLEACLLTSIIKWKVIIKLIKNILIPSDEARAVNKMRFHKVHGIGNDFILVNNIEEGLPISKFSKLSKKLCKRHFSIGADGILVLLSSDSADFQMRIFNADGSEAEMCGNGIRCIAKYVYEKGLTDKKDLTFETLAGIIKPKLKTNDSNTVIGITVDMGTPQLTRDKIPMRGSEGNVISEELSIDDETFRVTAVSMGNPHCIIFVDEFADNWKEIGPKVEKHPVFPQHTNVEFVQILSPTHVTVKVWERGAGATLACGTGASAVGVALILNEKAKKDDIITVSLPGGDLSITWASDGHVYMTGPAEITFEGQVELD